MEGIYLIQTREFVRLKENTYKIGRSHNLKNRVKNYPKNSSVILTIQCNNSVQCEKNLINIFKQKFIQKKEYGLEYFEGNMEEMIVIIENTIKENIIKENTIKENAIKENAIVDNVVNNVSDKLVDELVDELLDDEVDKLVDNLINDEVDNVDNSKIIQHICNRCHKDLKYLSHLQRHQSNKKDCSTTISNNIVSNKSNTSSNNTNDGLNKFLIDIAVYMLKDKVNKFKTIEDKKQFVNDFNNVIKLFNQKNNSNLTSNLTNTNSNTSESINIKNVCTDCNHKFSDRQGLNRHKKNGRCKGQNKLRNTITTEAN